VRFTGFHGLYIGFILAKDDQFINDKISGRTICTLGEAIQLVRRTHPTCLVMLEHVARST